MFQSPVVRIANAELLDKLVEEVRSFIDRIQHPRLKDYTWLERMQHAGEDLAARLNALTVATHEKQVSIHGAMKILAERLRAYAGLLAEYPSQQTIKEYHRRLACSYEEFLIELKKRQVARAAELSQSRQLKPINYARNLFHIGMGLTGIMCYWFLLNREQALMVLGAILAVFGTLEITRRFSPRWNDLLVDKVFGAISRPAERFRINSSTMYLLGLIAITTLFPRSAVLAAVAVLAFSDPAASVVGKRWGGRKLFRDKSVAGTIAFFVVGIIAVGTLLILIEPGFGIWRIVLCSVAIAAAGALVELFSSRVDDNFSIPIACALVASWLL